MRHSTIATLALTTFLAVGSAVAHDSARFDEVVPTTTSTVAIYERDVGGNWRLRDDLKCYVEPSCVGQDCTECNVQPDAYRKFAYQCNGRPEDHWKAESEAVRSKAVHELSGHVLDRFEMEPNPDVRRTEMFSFQSRR